MDPDGGASGGQEALAAAPAAIAVDAEASPSLFTTVPSGVPKSQFYGM